MNIDYVLYEDLPQEHKDVLAKRESKKILLKIKGMNHTEELEVKYRSRIWIEIVDGELKITPHKDDIEYFKRLTMNESLQSFENGTFTEHWRD